MAKTSKYTVSLKKKLNKLDGSSWADVKTIKK